MPGQATLKGEAAIDYRPYSCIQTASIQSGHRQTVYKSVSLETLKDVIFRGSLGLAVKRISCE